MTNVLSHWRSNDFGFLLMVEDYFRSTRSFGNAVVSIQIYLTCEFDTVKSSNPRLVPRIISNMVLMLIFILGVSLLQREIILLHICDPFLTNSTRKFKKQASCAQRSIGIVVLCLGCALVVWPLTPWLI